LGALGVWMNSIRDPQKAIEQYKDALRLGYTLSIPEIYSTAGVKFDFSETYLKDLAYFLKAELNALN
jgi:oligoendopeptidase F